MSLPTLLFGLLISTLLGALFHLLRGGGFGRLILYLILGWAGFWIGHFTASYFGWTFGSMGPLHLGMAILVSLIFLVIGSWLSLIEVEAR